MKIKSIPLFVISCVNIGLVLTLIILIILGIRPVSKLPTSFLCIATGIWALGGSIETKKQRQKHIEELKEFAKQQGWDKEF